MRSEEKHIEFDLSRGEDQDLNFNVTTGGVQDEAKLLSKKYAGATSQKKNREELVRSGESSQESESSAADARDN